jgi:hypothetical protein
MKYYPVIYLGALRKPRKEPRPGRDSNPAPPEHKTPDHPDQKMEVLLYETRFKQRNDWLTKGGANSVI